MTRSKPAPAPTIDPALKAAEVALALGIGRSTVYQIPWLRARAFIPKGTRGMRWNQSDITLYKHLSAAGEPEARSTAA